MRRREFIVGLAGALAWSVGLRPVRAQQPDRVRRIAFLLFAENDPEAQARVAAFRQALAQLGWTERNVQIEHRFAAGDFAQMKEYATEVVGSTPDVIVANSTPRPCGAKTGDQLAATLQRPEKATWAR